MLDCLSLDDIAAAVGANKYTLCHLYTDAKGYTMIEQLKRIRIAKAKHYLAASHIPVQEISKMCGFESPATLEKYSVRKPDIRRRNIGIRMLNLFNNTNFNFSYEKNGYETLLS